MSEPLLTARQLGDYLGFMPGTIVDWAKLERCRASRSGAD